MYYSGTSLEQFNLFLSILRFRVFLASHFTCAISVPSDGYVFDRCIGPWLLTPPMMGVYERFCQRVIIILGLPRSCIDVKTGSMTDEESE